MNYITNLLIISLLMLSSSCVVTLFLVKIMPKLGLVDVPGERRVHARITPRGGGIGFVLLFSIFLPVFEYIIFCDLSKSTLILQIFLPISIISFLDDLFHVYIPIRLVVHIISSCLAVMWIIHPHNIMHYEFPIEIDLAIGVFALLAFVNVYNFLDGIDGITAAESIHLSITILLLCFLRYEYIPNVNIIIIMAVLIGSWSLGFLFFNWQPASIFIGDTGSISIGFLLGICLLDIASGSPKLFLSCVIASLYYIADGSLTIIIRLTKGEKIWTPHLQHFFQKAVRSGKSHSKVVFTIIQCNMALMCLSISALYYPILASVFSIFVLIVTLVRLTA